MCVCVCVCVCDILIYTYIHTLPCVCVDILIHTYIHTLPLVLRVCVCVCVRGGDGGRTETRQPAINYLRWYLVIDSTHKLFSIFPHENKHYNIA